jgi:hypothetical protein
VDAAGAAGVAGDAAAALLSSYGALAAGAALADRATSTVKTVVAALAPSALPTLPSSAAVGSASDVGALASLLSALLGAQGSVGAAGARLEAGLAKLSGGVDLLASAAAFLNASSTHAGALGPLIDGLESQLHFTGAMDRFLSSDSLSVFFSLVGSAPSLTAGSDLATPLSSSFDVIRPGVQALHDLLLQVRGTVVCGRTWSCCSPEERIS